MRALSVPVARSKSFEVAHDLLGTFRRHRLTTHSTAIAFRILTSLVPLALLGLALLGVVGLERVWTESISPVLHAHLSSATATAADQVAQGIFEHNGAALLVLASLMVLWNTVRAVSEVEHALDEIHEREGQPKPLSHAFPRRLALAIAVDLCLIGALLTFVVVPRLVDGGAAHVALEVVRWVAAVVLLWAAVTLLVRYAPAEPQDAGWASGGSALVVTGWLVASVGFGVWSTSVANYKTAVGTLTAFLVLMAYTLVVAYVFVLGAQLDETLRQGKDRSSRREE